MNFSEADDASSMHGIHGFVAGKARNGTADRPRVAILMCTYNGASFLAEQLDSFDAQTFSNWTLYVSDDASNDTTRRILVDYQQRWGEQRLRIFNGPCKGFAENFISLIKRPELEGDYFAFSDQDDVWFPDKLERGIGRLASMRASNSGAPAAYCSRTRLVDACRNVIGLSPLFVKPPSFQNALVQSIAGANTMIINREARGLLVRLPADAPLVAHDWLTYLLVTGCGGAVIYDGEPSLDYRQHQSNVIGANAGLKDRLLRLRKMLSGRFVKWNDANLTVLSAMQDLLSEENKSIFRYFNHGRRGRIYRRLHAFRKAGVYRQTTQGNLSLLLAVFLGKV